MTRSPRELSDERLAAIRRLLEDERAILMRQVARARAAGPVKLDQTAVGRLSRIDA